MPLHDADRNIAHFIGQSDGKKILFVGIGNVLRSDDGVGVYVCRKIRESIHISTLNAEVSIENYIGKINSLSPEILVLIDCMYLDQTPGSYRLISLDEISDQTFNTHNISLNRLGDFFRMPTLVLGIQPQHIGFGETLSPAVKESADQLVKTINNNILRN